jgi:hypothetical protein
MAVPGMENKLLFGCLKYVLAIAAIVGGLIWVGTKLA